jgi:DNA repair exonuclease SbcCD ATPase subunit
MRDELRNSNVGQGQVTALLKQLETARREVETLHADLQHAQERLEIQHSSFALQDVELGELRRALDEVGDALTSALESSSHQSKEAERTAARLRQEVADLQAQIAADQRALMDAITTRELEKSVSSDARSRLETYLAEIDRLKVVEARLEAQVEDLQRRSAMEEVDKLEMGKQVSRLEEDKELLNVALDSKQTELVLLQRQLGQLGVARPGSTTPRTQRLAASTSRVPQTPCNVAGTPAPRRLSTSTAGSAMKSARRESSVVSNSSFIRPRQSSATRAVLGSSTRHNRTPEKARSGAQKDGGATTTASKIRSPSVGLRRQSSLPVLASHGALSGPMSLRRVTSLVEEEEGVDAVL